MKTEPHDAISQGFSKIMGIRVHSKSHADSLVYWSGDIITRYTTIHSNETETAKDGVESLNQ